MKRISPEQAQKFVPPGFIMDPKFPAEGATCGEEHVRHMLGVVWPIVASLRKVLVAQRGMSTYTIIGMFAVGDRDLGYLGAGHVFYIDYPGKGKTLLGKIPGIVVGGSSSRLQGLPDALPADYIGTRIIQIDPKTGARYFELVKGPGFSYIQLLDEFNRMTPRAQAAVLQAIGEGKITVGNEQFDVSPFAIITANPIEQEGTYPLSEAFLDRIMFQVRGQEFTAADFMEIDARTRSFHTMKLTQVCDFARVAEVRQFFHETIHVSNEVAERKGRFQEKANAPSKFGLLKELEKKVDGPLLKTVISGRGSLHLEGAARMLAALRYRNFVTPDDVLKVILPVIRHRAIFEPGVLSILQQDLRHRDALETTDYILGELIKEAW